MACAWRISSTTPVPPLRTIFAQSLLIDVADLFQSPPHAGEALQLLTDLGDLGGMKGDPPVLRARVIDVGTHWR
ncbi:MAG: hypothetical protein ACRD3H_07620 [Terriglobales bacterium]